MDDDLTRDVGLPLAGNDSSPTQEDVDDLDDNFDRELREAERDLEETEQPRLKIQVEDKDMDEDE